METRSARANSHGNGRRTSVILPRSITAAHSGGRRGVIFRGTKNRNDQSQLIISLQTQFFTKQSASIIAVMEVVDPEMHGKFGATKYILVVTATEQPSNRAEERGDSKARGHSGFHMPRLHKIKVKSGQTTTYTAKKVRMLRNLEHIELQDDPQKSFSLLFSGGKRIEWAPSIPNQRDEFLWWIVQVCALYLDERPTDNFDVEEVNKISSDLTNNFFDGKITRINTAQKQLLAIQMQGQDSAAGDGAEEAKMDSRIQVATMNDFEEQHVYHYLEEADLDVSSIDKLEEYLLARLAQLENDNVSHFFTEHTVSETDEIVGLLGQGCEQLEVMSKWISHNDLEMIKMKNGIARIENRNKKLEIQEKSHLALRTTLSALLDDLDLSPAVMSNLQQPDFEYNLIGALEAAEKLNVAMNRKFAAGIELMDVVKDQRVIYEKLRVSFSNQLMAFLEQVFQDCANNTLKAQDTTNLVEINSQSHRAIRKYIELARFLSRLEVEKFLSLRATYATVFAKVQSSLFQAHLATQQKNLRAENEDVRMSSFPETPVSELKHIRWVDHRSAPQSGKVNMSDVFNSSLHTCFALMQQEENFLKEFFHDCLAIVQEDGKSLDSSSSSSSSIDRKGQRVSVSSPSFPSSSSSSSAQAVRTRVRSSAVFTTSPKHHDAVVVSASLLRDALPVESMMRQLFTPLSVELKELCALGSSRNRIFSLDALVMTEELLDKHSQNQFGVGIVTGLQAQLGMEFNKFIDEQIAWFSALKPSAKGAGVLSPLLKCPAFVYRLMQSVKNAHSHDHQQRYPVAGRQESKKEPFVSQSADTSFQKLVFSMFKWLDGIANSDKKYKHVVQITNCDYFYRVFSGNEIVTSAASLQVIAKAEQSYEQHLREYIEWSFNYEKEMSVTIQFWDKLDSAYESSSSRSDVQFMNGLSKHDLRNITKNFLVETKLPKTLNALLDRVKKHFNKNSALVEKIWGKMEEYFLMRCEAFSKQVAECYQGQELTLQSSTVQPMFENQHRAWLIKNGKA